MRMTLLIAALLALSFGLAPLAAEVTSCRAYCDSSERSCAYKDAGELEDTYIVNRFIRSVAAGDQPGIGGVRSSRFRSREIIRFQAFRQRRSSCSSMTKVIDEEFTGTIASSDQYDCGRQGWRPLSIVRSDANEPEQGGIPLVWFDADGNVARIWHETEIASRKRMQLVEVERSQLHPSLREYVYPGLGVGDVHAPRQNRRSWKRVQICRLEGRSIPKRRAGFGDDERRACLGRHRRTPLFHFSEQRVQVPRLRRFSVLPGS